MPNVFAPTTRFGARAVLAAVALALVTVPFSLTLLLVEDRWAPLLRADVGARDRLHSHAVSHAGFVGAMQLISDSGSTLAWLAVLAAVVVWLLWRRLPRLALFVVVTSSGSLLLNAVVKTAVHRLRPALVDPVAHEPGLSFPSGHAQAAVVGYSLLLLVFLPLVRRSWRKAVVALAAFIVVSVGFSRVALGVHDASDVVGGFILGAAWVAAMTAAFNATRVDRGRSRTRRPTTGDPPPPPSLMCRVPVQRRPAAPAHVPCSRPLMTSLLMVSDPTEARTDLMGPARPTNLWRFRWHANR